MKYGEILFDSTKDNWSINTSVFDSKVINKNHLLFIVEDTEGNKFGGYIDAKIDKYYDSITDSKSFVFSLESNGRLDSMRKFNIEEPECAFWLYNKSDDCLFAIGDSDIVICKKGSGEPYCEQDSFNYEGNQNTLSGKDVYFSLKRFIVIQMT